MYIINKEMHLIQRIYIFIDFASEIGIEEIDSNISSTLLATSNANTQQNHRPNKNLDPHIQ